LLISSNSYSAWGECSTELAQCKAEVGDCILVLSRCNTAVEVYRKAMWAKNDVIAQQDKLLKHNLNEINDLESSRDAWYNNRYLLISIGFIAGGYVVLKVRR